MTKDKTEEKKQLQKDCNIQNRHRDNLMRNGTIDIQIVHDSI